MDGRRNRQNSKVQTQQQSPFNLSDESVSQPLSPPLSFSFKKVHPKFGMFEKPSQSKFPMIILQTHHDFQHVSNP